MDEYIPAEYFDDENIVTPLTLWGRFSVLSRGNKNIKIGIKDFKGEQHVLNIMIDIDLDLEKSIVLYPNVSGEILVIVCGNIIIFVNIPKKQMVIDDGPMFCNYKFGDKIKVFYSPYDQIFIVGKSISYALSTHDFTLATPLQYFIHLKPTWCVPTTSDGRYMIKYHNVKWDNSIIETSLNREYVNGYIRRCRIDVGFKYAPTFSLDYYKGYYIYVKRKSDDSPYKLLYSKYYDDTDDIDDIELDSQLNLYRNIIDYINKNTYNIGNIFTMHSQEYFILSLFDYSDYHDHIMVIDKETNRMYRQKSRAKTEGIRVSGRKILIQKLVGILRPKKDRTVHTTIFDPFKKWLPLKHHEFNKEFRNRYEKIFICLWLWNIPSELICEIITIYSCE